MCDSEGQCNRKTRLANLLAQEHELWQRELLDKVLFPKMLIHASRLFFRLVAERHRSLKLIVTALAVTSVRMTCLCIHYD